MTMTRGWRQTITLVIVVLIASVLLVWGNQRQAHATVPDPQDIFCIINGFGDPVNVFSGLECGEQGGTVTQCSDGLDNDGDGFTDVDDPGCHTDSDPSNADSYDPADNSESGGLTQCWDGIDNDEDGLIDWNPLPGQGDPDCATPLDTSETGEETPVDVCPNDPGVQTDESECTPEQEPAACADGIDNDSDGLVDLEDPGCESATDNDESNGGDNGGGGSNPACSDGIDNDSDGLIDLADPGCTSASDTDEANPTSGGGGSHRSSSSSSKGLVLGTSTTSAFDCGQYLNQFIRSGGQNDMGQVVRLQYFLKEFEGASLTLTGTYDAATLAAVNAFQQKYALEILTPWGISQPTGFVYLTTRKKVNELYCAGTKQFPLTVQEQQIITRSHTSGAVLGTQTHAAKPTLTVPPIEPIKTEAQTGDTDSTQTQEKEIKGQPPTSVWGAISSFFGGIFGR